MSKWHPITNRIKNKLSRNAWPLAEMQCKLIDEIITDIENKTKIKGIRELTNKLFPYNPDDPYKHLILLEQIEDYITKTLLNEGKQND